MPLTTNSAHSGRNPSHLCSNCRLMQKRCLMSLGSEPHSGKPWFSWGQILHQSVSGCPYPAAKIWCPIISQMAVTLERAWTHMNNLTWPVGGDWDRLGGSKLVCGYGSLERNLVLNPGAHGQHRGIFTISMTSATLQLSLYAGHKENIRSLGEEKLAVYKTIISEIVSWKKLLLSFFFNRKVCSKSELIRWCLTSSWRFWASLMPLKLYTI